MKSVHYRSSNFNFGMQLGFAKAPQIKPEEKVGVAMG